MFRNMDFESECLDSCSGSSLASCVTWKSYLKALDIVYLFVKW